MTFVTSSFIAPVLGLLTVLVVVTVAVAAVAARN
jgi:hypothetical protein